MSTTAATLAPPSIPLSREWLPDVDRLKGLTIFLVVWAHVYDASFPAWALNLRLGIYAFHMPLFMFLSGYIFVHVGSHRLKSDGFGFVAKRARRLLVPFLVMAAIVVVGKLVAGRFVAVDKPINDLGSLVLSFVIATEQSPVLFIWYLIVLFYVSVLTTCLHHVLGIGLKAILALALVLHVVNLLLYQSGIEFDVLYINRVMMYYVFFMIGCLACADRASWIAFVERYWIPAAVVFVVLDTLMLGMEWRYLVVGTVSMIAFHGMIRSLCAGSSLLLFLGQHSFAIYLFNLVFIGFAKVVVSKLVGPVGSYAIVTLLLCTAAGVLGPIVLKLSLGSVKPLRPLARAME